MERIRMVKNYKIKMCKWGILRELYTFGCFIQGGRWHDNYLENINKLLEK